MPKTHVTILTPIVHDRFHPIRTSGAGNLRFVRGLDYRVLEWINGWPQTFSPFLKFFSVAMSQLWVKVALGVFLIWLIWRGGKSRLAALFALASIGIANTLTNVFKEAWPVSRPFQDFPYIKVDDTGVAGPLQTIHAKVLDPSIQVLLRVGHSDSMGTASAHSANMAAVAFVMTYQLGWKWGIPWIFIALLTGISRVYTGAHYPGQVMLGWLCGIFAALVVIKTWEAWQRSRFPVQSGGDEEPELA